MKLKPYEVVEFSWGTAVRHRKGKWETLFLKPDGQEIDVSKMNVVLHDNGIEMR
jgi:hypothetical protein